MNNMDKKLLKDEIKDIKELNLDSIKLVILNVLETYFHSLFTYGSSHPITKDVINIWNEFIYNLIEENKFCKFFLKNSSIIDLYDCLVLFDLITDTNDKLISYIYDCLDDITSACETKCEFRAQHSKRDFKTIIENEEFKKSAVGLIINFEDIKKFLNYPKEFWDYAESRIRRVDSTDERNKYFYSTLMKFDDDNNLIDMLILVPYIINLETSLVNVHEFKHAYDLYNLLGSKISEDTKIYEDAAIKKEEEFSKKYILNKINAVF